MARIQPGKFVMNITSLKFKWRPRNLRPVESGVARVANPVLGDDELGLTTIEMVILLFIAVIILVALVAFFNTKVYNAVITNINTLLGTSFKTQ